ncbi:MAG: bifunctional adenosylcobinamide kinase/adenosylcobinamide-phosphate guanylyltransferase [Roseburia sp.]|nr:bifunctional adenosylcobinamide kinase/adenosylcobinamide-phosphate guanylyltransferase [Roseburia sp.]
MCKRLRLSAAAGVEQDERGEWELRLVIGGCAQGKLAYVQSRYSIAADRVWDEALPADAEAQRGTVVVNHVHQWVRSRLLAGGCPEEEMASFLDRHGDCILISDEVGNGIVPVEAFEREYRERVGRLLVWLAARAEEVERVICGIVQKIK